MQKTKVGFNNKANTTVRVPAVGLGFKTRTIYNSSIEFGESVNWKLDLYRSNNMSYAQVLKTAVKRKAADARTNASINIKAGKVAANNESVTGTHMHRTVNKVFTGCNYKYGGHKIKAKCSKGQLEVNHQQSEKYDIQCKNRFAPLSVEEVVCDMDSARGKHVICTSKSGDQISKNKANSSIYPEKLCKASNNDSSNRRKSGDQVSKNKANSSICPEKLSKASNNDASNQSSLVFSSNTNTNTDSSSKYDLPLRIKNKTITYKHVLPSCPTLQLWDAQNKFKFGFIPLGSQLMPDHVNPIDVDTDPITLHKIMIDSRAYNYLQNQINLKSQLNPDVWDQYLHDYWDKELPLLIRFGFPLDYNREGTLISQQTNHASAIEFPDDIQAYLDEEGHYKAILSPFKDIPIENMHISPMMTREKANAPHRRVIKDLSFPQDKSVNAGVPKDQYLGTPIILKLPKVDTITDQIKVLGRGCKLYKVDISRAFQHVKLDPKEYDLLGLRHERYYVDTCLPFGYRNGSALFQRLSDAVRHIMRQRHYDVINYIDDNLGIGLPSQIDASFDALHQILRELGLQVSEKKLKSPTTCLNCLGILINTETFTMSIPPQKLKEIWEKCCQ